MPIPPIRHKRGLDLMLSLRWPDKVDGYSFTACIRSGAWRADLECRPLQGSRELEVWCSGRDQAGWPVGTVRCDILGEIDGALAGTETFQIQVIPGVTP